MRNCIHLDAGVFFPSSCIATRDDGTACGAKAEYLDPKRGMVCHEHAEKFLGGYLDLPGRTSDSQILAHAQLALEDYGYLEDACHAKDGFRREAMCDGVDGDSGLVETELSFSGTYMVDPRNVHGSLIDWLQEEIDRIEREAEKPMFPAQKGAAP